MRWLVLFCGACSLPASEAVEDWQPLATVEWSLAPGSEGYFCALATVPEDTFIRSFRALAPPGTHHTLLTVTEATGPDGAFPCAPGTLSDAMVYGSGVATNDLAFPDGVAVRIPAGKQLLINVHVFNGSAEPLSGTSGTLAQTLPRAAVAVEAGMVFAGTTDFSIPPGAQAHASGSCRFDEDATLFGLWPHMHRYGTHMRIVHGATTLHDAPYRFDEQLHYPLEPRPVQRGETIEVTCSWQNTGTETVGYGDSTLDEMCWSGLYRYPAATTGLFCDGE